MSIVKVCEEMHDIIRCRSKALNRSINMQAEHWLQIGKLSEENPDMTYRDIWQKLHSDAEVS